MKAAIPKYVVDSDFATAPPGHRFGLYFPYWQAGSWRAEEKGKGAALKQTLELPPESRKQVARLNERRQALVDCISSEKSLTILARSISPLVTGMGMEHPLENGFAFLNPYGLPYLPGSSIKGVLRRAAQELIAAEEGGWDKEWETALFGLEPLAGSQETRRGALTFWDCIPELSGGSLGMDVMTPHYSEYYQGRSTPHDAGQPNPIVFMVIPPGSEFTFQVTCEQSYLPGALIAKPWKQLLKATFEHAFDWLGFGAKTSVGYGAMEIDQEKLERQRQQEETASRKAEQAKAEVERLAGMSPLEREIAQVVKASTSQQGAAYLTVLKALKEGCWEDEGSRNRVAEWIRGEMISAKQWIEQSKKKNPAKDKNHQRTLEVKKFL